MPALPPTTDSPLVRTSYTPGSDKHWAALQALLATPHRTFLPYLSYVDAAAWDQASPDALAHAAVLQGHRVAFIADDRTFSEEGYPVLVVDVDARRLARHEGVRSTRCVAREVWCPENNLNLGNMGWEEWEASCAAEGGVYRGIEMDRHEAEARARRERMAEGEQPPPMLLRSKPAESKGSKECAPPPMLLGSKPTESKGNKE